MKFKDFIQKIINCGVTPSLKVEEAQIIRLTNLFGMIPMIFYIIYIINGIMFDVSFFWKIGLVNALMNALCIWCNYKRQYAYAKTILLASNSFILLLFVNVVDGNSSAVAFFFPVLSCYVVFYDIIRDIKTVMINVAITFTCILLCLLLPEHRLGFVALPEFFNGVITRMNFLLAFSAFSIYIYTIIKVKLQTETLLIQSMETAEIMAEKSEKMLVQLTVQKDKAELANKTKAIFLHKLSNELKSPLNGIINTTRLLSTPQHDVVVNPGLESLRLASDQMLDAINTIVEFNKSDAKRLKLDDDLPKILPENNRR